MQADWINALLGGVIIGISVSMMLMFNGRVTGISGIINGAITPQKGETLWRVLFIVGLVLGGFVMKARNPAVFSGGLETAGWTNVAAGLLVGFFTANVIVPAVPPGAISINLFGSDAVLNLTGVYQLQSHTNLNTTNWANVPGVTTGPYTNPVSGGQKFFRLIN